MNDTKLPLKILHLNTEKGFRGGENQVLELATWLQKWRHHTEIACLTDEALWNKAKKRNLNCISFDHHGEFNIQGWNFLRKILKYGNYDIVHSHTSHTATMAGMICRLFPKTKCVVSRRVDFSTKGNLLRRWKYQYLPDKVIAISQGVKDILVKDGLASDKIVVISSGINPERFDKKPINLREKLGLQASDFLLMCVAELTEHKGHRYLLEAMPEIISVHPKTNLVIVGDGELRESLENKTHKLNISNNVHFMGYREDVPKILPNCDLFIMPSIEEGMGTSILDAMYCEKAVVASKVGGIPEIVEEGETGLLTEAKNHEALSKSIIQLINEPETRKKMGKAALKLVLSRFTSEKTAKMTEELYYYVKRESSTSTFTASDLDR